MGDRSVKYHEKGTNMKKHSKRFSTLSDKIEKEKLYPLKEAIKLVKETATTKFDSSIEAHFRLGIDPRKGEQQVRTTVVLPHGTGKTKKIVVFTNNETEGKESGADLFGGKELIEEIKKSSKIDFEVAIATPEIMRDLAVIAKLLGPRGLMPSPKNETVTKDVKKAVDEMKKGKVPFKNDDTGNIHIAIGRSSFTEEQLYDNFKAIYEVIRKVKPSSSKGVYLRNITITSTMGPGVKLAGIGTMTFK